MDWQREPIAVYFKKFKCHQVDEDGDMTTIRLNISDALAQAAGEEGLLETQAIEGILRDALRRKSVTTLLDATQAAIDIEPMDEAEVNEFVGSLISDVRFGGRADNARSA